MRMSKNREHQLHEVDLRIYNYVKRKQKETGEPVVMKNICNNLEVTDRQVRVSINALRHFYRGVAEHTRIIPHFIGETGNGFKIGETPMEDEELRDITAKIALKKANNLETKGRNITDDEKWGNVNV